MKSPRLIVALFFSVVLFLLTVCSAGAQQSWATYSGTLRIGEEDRLVDLTLTREPLGEWRGGKMAVVGWRYQGSLTNAQIIDTAAEGESVEETDVPPEEVTSGDSASGELSLKLFGLSEGVTSTAADSASLILQVKNGDSIMASIHGRFNSNGTLTGNWLTFGGDPSIRPFALQLGGQWTDDTYEAWYDFGFVEFWQSFREALRTRDAEKIASITRFPVLIGSCVPLFQSSSQETANDVPLNRKSLLKKFDRVFDSLTSAHMTHMEAVEAGVYQYWGDSSDKLFRVLKNKIIHWMVDPSGRRFEFARIGNRYMLVRVNCENLDGGC
jgi:hypothetical protein